jgi:hypothetical protein
MPYELPLPNALKRWKVKILDNELLCEEPHVTIVFKTELWRFGLRSRTFLDEDPKPDRVPKQLMQEVMANFDTLCDEWDARFPTNPISQDDDEDEEE